MLQLFWRCNLVIQEVVLNYSSKICPLWHFWYFVNFSLQLTQSLLTNFSHFWVQFGPSRQTFVKEDSAVSFDYPLLACNFYTRHTYINQCNKLLVGNTHSIFSGNQISYSCTLCNDFCIQRRQVFCCRVAYQTTTWEQFFVGSEYRHIECSQSFVFQFTWRTLTWKRRGFELESILLP